MNSERRVAGALLLAAALVTWAGPSMAAAALAGRVVFALGAVSARDSGGTVRPLARGDAVVAGDTIVTAAGRAQIKLTDGALVALNPDTEYAIEDYAFDDSAPDEGRSFFNLIRGGVRLVTARIGRVTHANWRMRTAVATIGIRGSAGHFFYVPGAAPGARDSLRINVARGAFVATDLDSGLEQRLGPGNYLCASPCRPLDGAAAEREDTGFFEIDEDSRRRVQQAGQDLLAGARDEGTVAGPIPAGPAPDDTHISVAFSFLEDNPSFPSFGPEHLLNALADGEATQAGSPNTAVFGSLEEFEWFTGFRCEPCIFRANGGAEIVDVASDGGTFNEELSAEWGRVTDAWTLNAFGQARRVAGHFHWVASTDPTPDSELPNSGTLVYQRDVGGTLATHTFGADGAQTEVATARTNVRIEVDYGNAGLINDFRISGRFPSGTTYVLQSPTPPIARLTDTFISFSDPQTRITVPSDACSAGCISDPQTRITVPSDACSAGCTTADSEFFGAAVFGPAGPNAAGITGSFTGNTNQFLVPEHTIQGTFIVVP